MAFFKKFFKSGGKKDEQVKKPQSPVETKKTTAIKVKKTVARKPLDKEMQRARAMALKLAEVRSFVEFCSKNNLGNPVEAFLRFYDSAKGDKRIWQLESQAEEAAEKANKQFSRTSFYGKLFLKCGGKPGNMTSILFKG